MVDIVATMVGSGQKKKLPALGIKPHGVNEGQSNGTAKSQSKQIAQEVLQRRQSSQAERGFKCIALRGFLVKIRFLSDFAPRS